MGHKEFWHVAGTADLAEELVLDIGKLAQKLLWILTYSLHGNRFILFVMFLDLHSEFLLRIITISALFKIIESLELLC